MLYDYQFTPRNTGYITYEPLNYASAESGMNRGVKGGIEEGVSNTATGVFGGLGGPFSQYMGIGKAAYSGFKSMDNEAGDSLAHLFAPHHTATGYWDDAVKAKSAGEKAADVFSGFASFDPIGGAILSAVRGNEKRREEALNKQMDSVKDTPFLYGFDDSGMIYGQPAKIKRPDSGTDLSMVAAIGGAMGGAMGGGYEWISDLMTKNKAGNEMGSGLSDASGSNVVAPSMIEGMSEISISGDGYDWNSDFTTDFAKGGHTPVMVKGGKGNDDVALVDTTTGQDTGLRVQKGEMLVVSQDKLSALREALNSGSKKDVFDIMKDQMSRSGESGGFAEGGWTEKLKEYSDAQLASLVRDGMRMSEYEWDKVSAEAARRGYDAGRIFGSLAKKNKQGSVIDFIAPQTDFDYFSVSRVSQPAKAAPVSQNTSITPLQYAKQVMSGFGQNQQAKAGSTGNKGAKSKNAPPTTTTTPMGWLPYSTYGPQLPPNYTGAPTTPAITPYVFGAQEEPLMAAPLSTGADTAATAKTAPSWWVNNGQEWLNNIGGTALDAYRMIQGFQGANTEVPEWEKPAAWNDYVGRMRYLSNIGLTPAQMAQAKDDMAVAYATDVANVRSLSGGNPAMALANLGRANMNRYRSGLDLTALDDATRKQNMQMYYPVLSQDVGYDRMIFGDKYNQAVATKQAGAQLANDALTNMKERGIYNQFYGKGSQFDKLQGLQLENQEMDNAILSGWYDYLQKNGFANVAPPNLAYGQ